VRRIRHPLPLIAVLTSGQQSVFDLTNPFTEQIEDRQAHPFFCRQLQVEWVTGLQGLGKLGDRANSAGKVFPFSEATTTFLERALSFPQKSTAVMAI
jgi:hypothetical protein